MFRSPLSRLLGTVGFMIRYIALAPLACCESENSTFNKKNCRTPIVTRNSDEW